MAISLQSITRGQKKHPPRLVIYGVGGIGKTTFAAQAPNPVFLCTENGLGSLDVASFQSEDGGGTLRTWQDVVGSLKVLATEPHDHKTVVIDSLDCLEPIIWSRVCETITNEKGQKVANIEDYGFFKGQRTHAPTLWRQLLAALDALNERGMGVILVAHSKIKKFEPPDCEAYERYQIKLDDAAAALVYDWADGVLFAQQRAIIKKEGKGFDERARAISTGERIVYTEERPAWAAKNRYSLPLELPLSYAAFRDALAASLNPATNNGA